MRVERGSAAAHHTLVCACMAHACHACVLHGARGAPAQLSAWAQPDPRLTVDSVEEPMSGLPPEGPSVRMASVIACNETLDALEPLDCDYAASVNKRAGHGGSDLGLSREREEGSKEALRQMHGRMLSMQVT
jgi:hypothetical protein